MPVFDHMARLPAGPQIVQQFPVEPPPQRSPTALAAWPGWERKRDGSMMITTLSVFYPVSTYV